MQLPCRGSGGPLYVLVDSTGIKVRGEGEWHARKDGSARRRVWRKVPPAVDEATLGVRVVEIAGCGTGDGEGERHRRRCPNVLPGLLGQIPADEPIASGEPASADGARDCRV